MSDAHIGIELRRAYPRVLARVLGVTRSLPQAEDMVQDAMARALETWPKHGRPSSVEAWLVKVATNRFLDGLRRRQCERRHVDTMTALCQAAPWSAVVQPDRRRGWGDDMLRLIFTCCDPALDVPEAAALTLATVIGLSTEEIAQAFIVKPRTMEQRLTRARQRLRQHGGSYAVPQTSVAAERIDAALCVVHLVFNEGYWSTHDERPIRRKLCDLAADLARGLHAMVPGEPEVQGLLAVILLHEARATARLDADGIPVALPDQDRRLYDRALIDRVADMVRATPTGPFQIEAAIAHAHCRAPTADDTDWATIAELYRQLESYRPTPAVRVNRAFAEAQATDPARGLLLLDEAGPRLEALRYPYAPMVRAVLLAQCGRNEEALDMFERAAALARNAHERAAIERRSQALRLRL